jgi:hypothetical protein
MSYSKILSDYYGLYDNIIGDKEDLIKEDEFRSKVDELVLMGYIETSILDDNTLYSSKSGLKWVDFLHIDDNIKKSILLLLVENPTTFFVLQNTQKGKMRITSLEIKQWGQDKSKKVVAFIIVDNDKTLADQSVDGLQKTFGEQKVRIFPLSSNSKTTFDDIKTYIDAYANDPADDYPMPLIALLANNKQCEKMLKLIHHIHNKVVSYKSLLRYGIVWDEADKTYPMLRDKQFNIERTSISCYTYIVDNTIALYRLGFVTATDGDLLEEEYPECSNAYLYPVVIAPEDQEHYRALHHPEAITHQIPFTSKHTNNSYAIEILEEYQEHFITPITLTSGEIYYRKIIVNSNAKTEDMKQFAKWCNSKGINALVFNGNGGCSVKVYRSGLPIETHKTKGKKFNELLFYIYKKLNLNEQPLIIIGRRKVDRGLGFHYCPRTDDETTIDGLMGPLITKNREGLIWTDEILGRIDNKDVAVQKAGRLAGIIGNSPQYPRNTHYWTDEYTEKLIRKHNTIVDYTNNNSGCSISQAVSEAKKNVKELLAGVEDPNDPKTIPVIIKVSEQEYLTFKKPRNIWDDTSIFNIIRRYDNAIVEEIQRIKNTPGWERDQIVEPDINANTYTVYITNFSKAADDKKRHYHVGNCKNKYIDRFQIYLDKIEKRVIISIYYGSKVPQLRNTLVNP